MGYYFKKALNWTFCSQVGLVSVIVYIIAIPLLNTSDRTYLQLQIWLGLALVIILKYLNVQIEFNFDMLNRGKWVYT